MDHTTDSAEDRRRLIVERIYVLEQKQKAIFAVLGLIDTRLSALKAELEKESK